MASRNNLDGAYHQARRSSGYRAKGEVTRVSVSGGVLWIGSDAYPLRNIARAQARELTFKRDPAWRPWLRGIVCWAVAGAVVAGMMKAVLHVTQSSDYTWLWSALLALVIISTLRLIAALRKPTRKYYSLVVETAGTPRTALVSTDEVLVGHLVTTITSAIDDHAVAFDQTIINFSGDSISQYGDHNVGR